MNKKSHMPFLVTLLTTTTTVLTDSNCDLRNRWQLQVAKIGLDGVGARAGRLLSLHLHAAGSCLDLYCTGNFHEENSGPHPERPSALHGVVPIDSLGNESVPIYCHRMRNINGTGKTNKRLNAFGWAQYRCYQSQFLNFINIWANCSTKQQPKRFCTVQGGHKVNIYRSDDTVKEAALARTKLELNRIQSAWKKSSTSDELQQCGYANNVLDIAVHIRAGDRLKKAIRANAFNSVYVVMKYIVNNLTKEHKENEKRLRFHIFSETNNMKPVNGNFFEFESRLYFHNWEGNVASLDNASINSPLGGIHMVLNAEPTWSLMCLARADMLLLSTISNFAEMASALNPEMPVALLSNAAEELRKDAHQLGVAHGTRELFLRNLFQVNPIYSVNWHFVQTSENETMMSTTLQSYVQIAKKRLQRISELYNEPSEPRSSFANHVENLVNIPFQSMAFNVLMASVARPRVEEYPPCPVYDD
eukprot:m.12962 g.12962  ORF g.12962 m.12962 type:complete len:474 (+) comp4761_c0_seq1:319-1740(+)